VLSFARREPSAVLLAAQLAGVLLYPAMEGNEVGRSLFAVFGILILALVVLAVRSTPSFTWFAILLGVPATILLLIQAVTQDDALLPYSSALEAVLYFYAAYALISYMLEDHVITRDELFAVGATFTLVAWAFAYTFTVYQAIEPDSFTAAVDPGADRSWMELLFLSFTTLSSTGLSDVVPIAPFARSLVMLEQLAGVAYIAMVVSRLVGLLVLSRSATAGGSAPGPAGGSRSRGPDPPGSRA
jgi:Ion channel